MLSIEGNIMRTLEGLDELLVSWRLILQVTTLSIFNEGDSHLQMYVELSSTRIGIVWRAIMLCSASGWHGAHEVGESPPPVFVTRENPKSSRLSLQPGSTDGQVDKPPEFHVIALSSSPWCDSRRLFRPAWILVRGCELIEGVSPCSLIGWRSLDRCSPSTYRNPSGKMSVGL